MPESSTTARDLADTIFMFGRTLRSAIVHHDTDILPSALTGVLFVLARAGECRASELAAEIGVSQSSLSRQIGELVDKGLVDRHPDPDDRRAHRVSCSASGHEVLALVGKRRTERLSAALAEWDDDQIVTALDVLDRLDSALASISGCHDRRNTI